MWPGDEIEIVEDWRDVWWNLESDTEFTHAVTGTPWMPLPRLERRRIQNIYGKAIHKGCGGNLVVPRHETGICTEPMQYEVECVKCGKRLVAEA